MGRRHPSPAPPSERLSPIETLVARSREITSLQYPPSRYPEFAFDAPVWRVAAPGAQKSSRRGGGALRRVAPKSSRTVRFLLLDSKTEPLPVAYALVIRAWVVLSDKSPDHMRNAVHASRYLWAALGPRFAATEFDWARVRRLDFERAETLMKAAGAKVSTIVQRTGVLRGLATWLEANEICTALDWTPETPQPRRESKYRGSQGAAVRNDRLPTRRAIEGLAEIYRIATPPQDRLLICAIGLLLVCGFRVSELLSLPEACEITELFRGRERYGIRFWKAKASGRFRYSTRWLSPLGVLLARDLIAEIRGLTAEARAQARVLYAAPDRVVVPRPDRVTGMLDRGTVAWALGVLPATLSAKYFCRPFRPADSVLPGRERTLFVRAEIEAYLLDQRGSLGIEELDGRPPQTLADTLLVTLRGFFAARSRQAPCPLLVDPVSEDHVGVFLGNSTGRAPGVQSQSPRSSRSAFARYGIAEPKLADDGTPLASRMRSHMPRHWVNTLASKAGMSAFQITLWMGRRDEVQTQAYLHDEIYQHSADDYGELVRELIARGDWFAGTRQDVHDTLPEVDRPAYRELIRAGHKLRSGVCTIEHVEDCPLTKACWADCPFFLRTLHHAGEREELARKRQHVAIDLERLDLAERVGLKVQPRQRALARALEAGLARAEAADGPSEHTA